MRAGMGRKEKQTWMLSWSDLQASIVTASGWFGARTVKRNLPPKIRKMGESAELAYSWSIHTASAKSIPR